MCENRFSADCLRGFNRGFSMFFNIDKLLFCFIKLYKCAHKYKKCIIIIFKYVKGDALPPERPKIWHARRRGYFIFYFCYDHVT